MKKTSISFCIYGLFILFLSCSESNSVSVISNCDKQSEIIDETSYNLVNTSNYVITGIVLNEDCLDVTIGSSGCDANNWTMNLFSTNNFSNTNPIQRNIKVELVNQEACAAAFQKTVSFDLTPLRVSTQTQIIFNIDGWNEQIVYNY